MLKFKCTVLSERSNNVMESTSIALPLLLDQAAFARLMAAQLMWNSQIGLASRRGHVRVILDIDDSDSSSDSEQPKKFRKLNLGAEPIDLD